MICSMKFKKDVVILKYFGFCAFGFEAMPYLSCYLISVLDKTHYGAVIALFSVQLQELF